MFVSFAALAAMALAQPSGPPDEAAMAAPRVYPAIRAVDPIVVDGKPNERTWQLAPIDDRFGERQPNLGATPPVRTTLQVAYDDQNLYVFLNAYSEPGDVVVRTLRRDNDGIFSDDAVYVKIDPSQDRRTAYSLGVNADGAQIDALGLEDGRQFILEWDGVWSAETQRREDGYTVEYRIPFAILGIKSADERTIGLNITRDHPSRNATYDWRIFVPPRSPMAASQFGEVPGLRNIRAQRAIEYTPYVLGRTNFEPGFAIDPRLRPNFAMGGDARVQIGAGSYVELSVLTDFAQVEADEVQVARDRFPLFFPERRPFFINGLDVFNFGRPGEAQLFFSRRIGLEGGQPVPIGGGLKVYGRAGPVSYGLLQVQTLGSPRSVERGIEETPPENFTVARVRTQVTRIFNLGLMMLGRHTFGSGEEDHGAGGVDAQIITRDGKFAWYGFVAGTWNERARVPPPRDLDDGRIIGPGRDATSDVGSSAHSIVEYRGLYVRPSLMWLWSDRDFAPQLGFYRRPGTTRQEARIDFVPRPEVLGLREIRFGPAYSIETDPGYGERLGQVASSSIDLNWKNGSSLGYRIEHFVDEVQQPFELYGFTVDAGRYTGLRQAVSASSPSRRVFGVNGSYEYFELFGGIAHQPSLGVTLRAGKHFTLAGRYTHLLGHLEDRNEIFNFGFANGNVDIALTRNLAFDNLFRLDLSPGRERVGLQSRLRWRFAPGSDLFIVYRTDQPLGPDPVGVLPRAAFHELTVKMTYYLRAFIGR